MENKRKRLSRAEKEKKAVIDLINQMFIIAGHEATYDDVGGVEDWYTKYTMTVEQGEVWKKWGEKYLRENLGKNKKQAEMEMMWFNLQYGLKYSDFKK